MQREVIKMGWSINDYIRGDDRVVYIDIHSLDAALESIIDNYIVKICYGDTTFSIKKAKKYVQDFIDTEDEERKKGAVSEFFLHLYLNSLNMKQECTFKNLEENSPKKGFDGVYKDSLDEVWYMESKSGAMASCTHKSKVEEAYRDLRDKFLGKTTNDPWINAYNHVKAVDSDKSLLDMFRILSDDFDDGIVHGLNEFNIVPCGTVLDDSNTVFDGNNISSDVFRYFKRNDYNKLIAICVTQRAIKEFEGYLKK